jgi:hypothetical protein
MWSLLGAFEPREIIRIYLRVVLIFNFAQPPASRSLNYTRSTNPSFSTLPQMTYAASMIVSSTF